jgi:hypothetical protein
VGSQQQRQQLKLFRFRGVGHSRKPAAAGMPAAAAAVAATGCFPAEPRSQVRTLLLGGSICCCSTSVAVEVQHTT